MIEKKYIDELATIELRSANEKHPKYFASQHETYAVLKEELEETRQELDRAMAGLDILWEQVKLDVNIEDALIDLKKILYLMIAEAVQVYAMCEKGLITNAIKETR